MDIYNDLSQGHLRRITIRCSRPAKPRPIAVAESQFTVGMWLVRRGQMTEQEYQEALTRPSDAHRIMHYLGRPDMPIEIELHSYPLYPGDSALLCTDGCSHVIEETEVERALQIYALPDAANHLIKLHKDRRGEDDATVLMISFNKRN